MNEVPPQRFSLPRTLKLGSFHIGSAFVDLLTSGVLNRVLITDLHLWATPVALLSALRYLLAPLSIWAGYWSDTRPIFGLHRLPYILAGRVPMILSLPLLPVATVLLAADGSSILGWALAVVAFLIYGFGTLFSGGVFLALIRDNAPPARRGLALSIAQIFLVLSFPIAAVVYAKLMPVYDSANFWRITLLGMAIAGSFIGFSLFGAEQRGQTIVADHPNEQLPFKALLHEMWADRRTRFFFLFLALGALSAFAQDAVLEPFGGHVFGMDVGETTRFNAFWGVGVLITLVGTIVVTRRRQAHEQTSTTVIGLILTSVPLALLGVVALTANRALVIPVIVLFGLGFGVYSVGAMSLLMAMTADRRAGAYLGLWTMAQLLFRGFGVFLGGLIRDLAYLASGGNYPIAYASVFILSAVGLGACILLLLKADVAGFARSANVTQVPIASFAAAAE